MKGGETEQEPESPKKHQHPYKPNSPSKVPAGTLVTWVSGGLGSAGVKVGVDGPKGLFHPG